jgi:hypothetical protein
VTEDTAAARILLATAARVEGPRADAEAVLSAPNLDWGHWARYLTACGLALPLLGALGRSALGRLPPPAFVDHIRGAAVRSALTGFAQDAAIHALAEALRTLGARGVLLKGTALRWRDAAAEPRRTSRGTGDVDIYVDPNVAPRLRAQLLAAGWQGAPGVESEAPHHLAPISYRSAMVEIHTRLVPPFWALPEREMLARAVPLREGAPLDTLSPEGIALHAAVHTAQDCFSHGLKSAWDVLWVLRTHPRTDWDLLARWIGASRARRGIWAPLTVFADDLALALPPALLAHAPTDERQRRLQAVARRRLFRVAERPEDLDPGSRQGLRLLMHDSWWAFAGYVRGELAWRRTRGTAWRGTIRRASAATSTTVALARFWQYCRPPKAD